MTEFVTRTNSKDSKYRIIFDTDNERFYKTVQEVCRLCIDSENGDILQKLKRERENENKNR